MDGVITSKEAAKMLDVKVPTIRWLVYSGYLHWYLPGYLDRLEVLAYLDNRNNKSKSTSK